MTADLSASLPDPSPEKLPLWRGFNLLEKFSKQWSNKPFVEDDFKWIAEFGFNFVRLPMDYRTWILDGDWRKFDEKVLAEIDQAVEWGKRYGIHVCINFHRAPGYCVNPPKEEKDLWTDPEAQEVAAMHWAAFARRYKGVPNRNLSFDLFNEPNMTDGAVYYPVVKIMVEAIRREDPDRLVIADGMGYGNKPAMELVPLKVAQSTRGYVPFNISHFRASWIGGSDKWPAPSWPARKGMTSFLYGPAKPDLKSALEIRCDLSQPAELGVNVDTVSGEALLVVKADGQEVLSKKLVSGPGEGEWKKVVYREEWKVYQNVFDREYTAKLPRGTRHIVIENQEGDWMTFSQIRIDPFGKGEIVLRPASTSYGDRQGAFALGPDGKLKALKDKPLFDRKRLWKEAIEPWQALERQGVGIHVGEWGAFNKTPHDVTLAWMEDCLKNWQKAGWGWALWNFRGSFGILDSEREDAEYTDFKGHKLDHKMLKLLQKYR